MKTVRFVSCVFVLLTFAATACGGSFVSGEGDDSGTSGGSTSDGAGEAQDDGVGGSENAPGAGGGAGGSVPTTGGAPGTGAAGLGGESADDCYGAVCDAGDIWLETIRCPIGAECYENVTSCARILCMKPQAFCNPVPACDEDETQVELDACPQSSCVFRAECGTIIACDKLEACDVGQQPHRSYVGRGSECVGLDFTCPQNTSPFDEPCGCGCEQPSSCPEFIDCLPSSEVDPLCLSAECPYSNRLR